MNKTIIYNKKKLSYQISGKGPAIVLIHGFGEDGNVWQHQVLFLEKDFTVLVPFLPGSGSSEIIDDMSMEGFAACIAFILRTETLEESCVIGHSMGGYVTLAFAEKYSSLLNSFGLFHSTALADSEEKKAIRKKGIQSIKESGPKEFLKTTVSNLYASHTKETNPSIVENHLKEISYFSAEALIAYYEAMMNRPERVSVLEQNKWPVLFVLGRQDAVIPLEQGLQQVSLPGISYIHILEHSGHMGMREEPDVSNNILKSFLLKTN